MEAWGSTRELSPTIYTASTGSGLCSITSIHFVLDSGIVKRGSFQFVIHFPSYLTRGWLVLSFPSFEENTLGELTFQTVCSLCFSFFFDDTFIMSSCHHVIVSFSLELHRLTVLFSLPQSRRQEWLDQFRPAPRPHPFLERLRRMYESFGLFLSSRIYFYQRS